MAVTRRRRKSNTALVFNPNRSLSIGGARKSNPTRKRRRRTRAQVHHRRRNPVAKMVATRKRNPRRRRNPSTVSGLVFTAIMAGVGVSLFDAVAQRALPQSSRVVRAGVKLGGAYLFQSKLGAKIPVLSKYKNDIALVLAVAGVVDLMQLYVLPIVSNTLSSLGLPVFIPAGMIGEGDGTTGDIWNTTGNAMAYGAWS